MRFSEAWLRELVNPNISTQVLVDQLTMAGLEVDGFQPVAVEFTDVVVGEILAVETHPGADKLVICTVDNGIEKLQVVCGAPNAREGIKVPFAKIGAEFPELKIKKAKLRGVESNGMLCSELELGLSDNNEGLLELAADAPVGADIRDYLGLDDVIIDLDLTPNRSDCLSILGLARETGLLNSMDIEIPAFGETPEVIDDTFPVELRPGDGCPRFAARVIRNVDVSAVTPIWMREKLRRAGIRSIDPVVDITNYVMLELGQPLHAYDLEKLTGKLVVRRSQDGEECTLLDGSEISLIKDTLVITDDTGPIALAGVMGGLSTSVTTETRHILFEAAFFEPAAIAGRARSYGMSTDAAHRFERGVDWQGQARALERATELLLMIAGGSPGPTVVTTNESCLPTPNVVKLRASRISRLMGVDIDQTVVEEILDRLGFESKAYVRDSESAEPAWEVSAPSHRFDIAIEADLIEEISRVFGYNNLPVRTPKASLTMLPKSETALSLNRLKDQLVGRGWYEAVTYSFVDADLQSSLNPEEEPVVLANPLSSDMSVMRTTIWTGLVNSLIYNVNRQQDQVKLFESGLCFSQSTSREVLVFEEIIQVGKLAGVACGRRETENWANSPEFIDFYDVKGDLESIFALVGEPEDFSLLAGEHPGLHPGQTAKIEKNSQTVGYIGLLDPRIQKKLDCRYPIFLFEIETNSLISETLSQHSALSRFPEVRRDIAILVKQTTSAEEVRSSIIAAADETLVNLKLFDVYQGKGIDPNRKSMAMGLTFRDASRTLTDDEINNSMNTIVSSLETGLGASLRN